MRGFEDMQIHKFVLYQGHIANVEKSIIGKKWEELRYAKWYLSRKASTRILLYTTQLAVLIGQTINALNLPLLTAHTRRRKKQLIRIELLLQLL